MIEREFEKEKKRLEEMTAPPELENRLRSALATTTPKPKRYSPIWKSIAVALILFTFIGYNYNAFAYYGKQLFGFDELMSDTLLQLNEDGMGQAVEKSIELDNDTVLTINGIMTDANRTIIYYTLTNPKGLDLDHDYFRVGSITGLFTNASVISTTWSLSDSGTEIKGTMDFEPVSPFAKTLTVNLREHDEGISFPYNPKLALQTQLKSSINKTITVDKGNVRFEKIIATPTMTLVEGILNVDNFDRVPLGLHGIELLANGEPVAILGSGATSSIRGTKFEIRYDALPKEINSLELLIKDFVGYQNVAETYSLDKAQFLVGDKDLLVKNIEIASRGVEIELATDLDVMLDGVQIGSGAERVSLTTTRNQYTTEINNREMKVRTLIFETDMVPDDLFIQGYHYQKQYNEKITILLK
ncbi:DUF4179 domain-containing protein [Anaerobacillus alkaliphilus]|uniref:DUF4179 domain-containing protein n=1 Tax=Anaerobacillus alkaliphilus TaxID=1548597 RepID=A0A4Q0VVC4_9BACI|nr:DUF4179 domain-containing protein [Anaerobacillus alkaliphilus]RXJ02433.1 DUF4179 domain-containing protein [Anaerobacillus alkaliphilus]